MPLSEVPFSLVPSLPSRKVAAVTCNCLPPKTYGGNFGTRKVAAAFSVSRNLKFVANSISRDDDNNATASVEFDGVSIPSDYSELLEQDRKATDLALKDNKQLMKIEFPNSGLESVPGDGEGGIEMTESMQLIREFYNRLINPEKAARTRIIWIVPFVGQGHLFPLMELCKQIASRNFKAIFVISFNLASSIPSSLHQFPLVQIAEIPDEIPPPSSSGSSPLPQPSSGPPH